MPGARSGSSTRHNVPYVPAIKVYDCLPDVGDYGITRAKALGEIGVAIGAPVEVLAMYTLALAWSAPKSIARQRASGRISKSR
jgi:hypothetical protein